MSTLTSAKPDLPGDIVVDILERVESPNDLTRCALVNWLFNRCATPFLYRSMNFRFVRTPGPHHDVILPQNVLLQRPEYARYVHHIGQSGSFGDFEADIETNIRKALRLCRNLRSFSWVYAQNVPAEGNEFADDLDILRQLPIQSLIIRTAAGINEQAWIKLTQLVGLQSIEIWSARTSMSLFPGWSVNLRKSLVSVELGSSLQRDKHLAFLSELPNLKHLRSKGLSSTSIFQVLKVLPKLESLSMEYIITGKQVKSRPFTASLRRLQIATSIPNRTLAEPLWEWLMQLVPVTSLETLEIQTASMLEIPKEFLKKLAETHGPVLKKLYVAYLTMSASDVADLCHACPHLESISCTMSSTADELSAALSGARSLRHIHVNLKRGTFKEGYLELEQAKAWMMRDDSRLRKIEVNREIYEGRWVLSKDSRLNFEVTCSTIPYTWG